MVKTKLRYDECTDLTRALSAQSATDLVQALLDQIPEDDHATVISVKQDSVVIPPTNGQSPATALPKYDPSAAYILEFCTILAVRDAASVEGTGKQVFDTLQRLLRDSAHWHPVTVSRVTFYALVMLKHSYVSGSAAVPFRSCYSSFALTMEAES